MKSLRLLLDQMLDVDVAEALVGMYFDVLRVSFLGLARAEDDVILTEAIAQGRVLVTLDEHFGDWAVLPLQNHPGVIRVKANPATTDNVLAVLIPFLQHIDGETIKNKLAIVSCNRVRWIKTGGL